MTVFTKNILLACVVIGSAFGIGLAVRDWQQAAVPLNYFDCPQLQQGICNWDVSQQQWQLTLPANNLVAMAVHPLRLSTTLSHPPPLELRLEGIDMYMGEVKIQLQPNSNGVYLGELLLPICNTGKMRWKGQIVSLDQQQPVALSFEVNSQ